MHQLRYTAPSGRAHRAAIQSQYLASLHTDYEAPGVTVDTKIFHATLTMLATTPAPTPSTAPSPTHEEIAATSTALGTVALIDGERSGMVRGSS